MKLRWDKIYKKWLVKRPEYEDWQIAERENFAAYLPKEGLFLDIGCADCRDSQIFKSHGLNYIGLDFSEIVTTATETVVCADAAKPPFKEQTFDGVWSCSTLKYLPEKAILKAIEEVWRILKPEGYFWLGMDYGIGTETNRNCEILLEYTLFNENSIKQLNPLFTVINCEIFAKNISGKQRKLINFILKKNMYESI